MFAHEDCFQCLVKVFMNTTEIIITIIGVISTALSGWMSWFFTRKKYNSEVDSNYIKNLQEALKTYDNIIENNRDEINELMKKNDQLREEVSDLRKQLLNLTMNICMDLTCIHRIREIEDEERKNKLHSE